MSERNKAESEEVSEPDPRVRSFKARKPAQKKASPVDLASRLALRPREVAQVLGISERMVRQILPELPHTRIGCAVVVPTDLLAEWLRKRVRSEEKHVKVVVDEVVTALKEGR